MSPPNIYKVIFHERGKVIEIFARQVSHSSLMGFVEVEELVFGETSSLVVDPSEERLQREFEGVQRTFIPVHAVVRIDQVEKEGTAKITDGQDGDNVRSFPVPLYPPSRDLSD